MKEHLLQYLTCPNCSIDSELEVSIHKKDPSINHIMEGELHCTNCKSVYPIAGGVPFFCSNLTDSTIDLNRKNFADEWTYFTSTIDKNLAKDELDSYFHDFVSYKDLNNKVVLDGGCGGGRFCYVVASESNAKEIIGIDLSNAVLTAFNNTKHFPNVNIIQADITKLPFKRDFKTFDFIYSVGVIHHLPNPQEGFSSLVNHLKENGKILAWVYGKEGNGLYINLADPVRQLITSRLPFRINLLLSFTFSAILWSLIWIIYFPLNKLIRKSFTNKLLPFNEYFDFFRKRGFKDFWRTILDKMIPTISYYISKDEFTNWFKVNNLKHKIYFRNGHSWLGIGEHDKAIKETTSKDLTKTMYK